MCTAAFGQEDAEAAEKVEPARLLEDVHDPVYQGVALPALPKGLQSLPDYLIGLRWQLGLELVHVYLWVHVLLYHRWWVPARYFGRLRAGPVPPNTAV